MAENEGDGRRYTQSSSSSTPPDFPLPLATYHPRPHYYDPPQNGEAGPSVSGSGSYGLPHAETDSPYSDENETLAARLVDMLVNALKGLKKGSHSVVSLDLRRAALHDARPQSRRRKGSRNGYGSFTEEADCRAASSQKGWMDHIHGGGARLKLLQVWDFQNPETGETKLPWGLNLGFGLSFQIDSGKLEPKIRIRGKHACLQMLPQPLLELRGKWPLANTGLAVDAKYRIPLEKVIMNHDFGSARLLVSLFNPLGSGFHLTPGGLDFDEHVVQIGSYTKLRVAASVEFPRQFPFEKGDNPFKVEFRKLGLKTIIP